MMKQLTILTAILISLSTLGQAQLSPPTIIEKSIAFHDPEGLLSHAQIEFQFVESRPNGADRHTQVIINQAKEYYKIDRNRDGDKISMSLSKGEASFSLNGSAIISDEDVKKYRMSHDRLVFIKNYYRYLWLLPEVLKDPGTILSPTIKTKDFFGKDCLEIKATYEDEIGHDIWYFYFNPKTYALEGYRFYHDESANDGEYILLSEMTSSGSVKLPKVRKWYTHKEDKFLGTDILQSMVIKE